MNILTFRLTALAEATDQRFDRVEARVSTLESAPAGGGTWGSITGTLSAQADLSSALAGKASLTGAAFTGAVSATNLSGTNTGDQDLSGYATTSALTTGLSGKEPTIAAGTTAQYWRGDKSWQTLDKSAVGLANVDNTSDAAKPVSTATQAALDGKLSISAFHGADFVSGKLTYFDIGDLGAGQGGLISFGVDDTATGYPYFILTHANGSDSAQFGYHTANDRWGITGSKAFEFDSAPYVGTNVIYHAGNLSKTTLGLGNVDNTSDANKPVSTAQQAAIDAQTAEPTDAQMWAGTDTATRVSPRRLATAAAPQTLTDGATTTWDMSAGFNAKWTLGGNRTLAVSNPIKGWTYSLGVIQDATGSRTVTWPSSFDWGTTGAPTLTTTASKRDRITLFCTDAVTPKFDAFLSGKGFS